MPSEKAIKHQIKFYKLDIFVQLYFLKKKEGNQLNRKNLSIGLIILTVFIIIPFIPNRATEAKQPTHIKASDIEKVEKRKETQIQQIKLEKVKQQLSLKQNIKKNESKESNTINDQKNINQSIEPAKTDTPEPINNTDSNTQTIDNSSTQRTDGFNFNGYHFDVQWFSGVGQVPATQYIYRWTSWTNHYLVEHNGAAGGVVWTIQVGTTVIVDGQQFTCYKILNHINRMIGLNYLENEQAPLSVQTCETNADNSPLTLWFFH